VDPASFYTGLVADLYGPLRSVVQDPEPYARFIELSGQPALELGCGDGDPLLDLRGRGLDVEGVDSSADMLARCRRRADEAGLDVVVHHQRMESLDLGGRRFRTIFLAGPTFNLLADDDTAARALGRIRAHLDDGGAALVPLFIPPPVDASELGRVREAVDARGSVIRFQVTSATRDEAGRRQETMTRYERLGDDPATLERPWIIHWHTQAGFRSLAASAGLSTVAVLGADGSPVDEHATEFAFWLSS
jgi:SAM-dependent methyltransferase